MSLLNYFKRRARERPTAAGLSAEQLPTSEDTGLNQPTVDAINSALFTLPTKRKRTVYTPVQRALIGKYANEHGVPKAVKQLSMDFPNLCTKTVIRMQCDYNEEAEKKGGEITVVPGKKRGRPPFLPEALQASLEKWVLKLREAGGVVNKHVVTAALFGIIESNPQYSDYVHFVPTRGWLNHLYSRLNLSRRRATTSRPPISVAAYNESVLRFHHKISSTVRMFNIPDSLVITIDQTPSRYMEVTKMTMASKNSKRVAIANSSDKRAITITLGISLSGDMLPYQLIYSGKTTRCLPDRSLFPDAFLLSYNPNHWSNETETRNLLNKVIDPYAQKIKSEQGLQADQKTLLIWDDFKAHNAPSVIALSDHLNIVRVDIPKNFTHLVAPLDLTVNKKLKEFEQAMFSDYYSAALKKSIIQNPDMDVADIRVDTKLSTLKPIHATSLRKSYEYFKTDPGKTNILNGWRASGITKAVNDARDNSWSSLLDPFANLQI